MDAKKIYQFIKENQYQLDEPEVYVPDVNQVNFPDTWREDATKICLLTPVPFSSSIQNMGVAILYDLINNDMGKDYLCTRAYYPESKLFRRMKKEGVPLFDKECFHSLREYDVIGFAMFYALVM